MSFNMKYVRILTSVFIWFSMFVFSSQASDRRSISADPCLNVGNCSDVRAPGELCDCGFTPFDHHCYLLVQSRLPWREADAHCLRMNAGLADMRTVKERRFVARLAQQYRRDGCIDDDLWLNARIVNGRVRWRLKADAWRQINKKDDEDECAVALAEYGYTNFTGNDCRTNRHVFVCKKAEIEIDDMATTAMYDAVQSSTIAVSEQNLCVDNAEYYNGKCYKIYDIPDFSERSTWENAEKYCANNGGALAEPDTPEIHKWIIDLLGLTKGNSTKSFWIGGHHSAQRGVSWTRSIGSDFIPEDAALKKDECLAYLVRRANIDQQRRITWVTRPCSSYLNWICQFDVGTGTSSVITTHEETTVLTTLINIAPGETVSVGDYLESERNIDSSSDPVETTTVSTSQRTTASPALLKRVKLTSLRPMKLASRVTSRSRLNKYRTTTTATTEQFSTTETTTTVGTTTVTSTQLPETTTYSTTELPTETMSPSTFAETTTSDSSTSTTSYAVTMPVVADTTAVATTTSTAVPLTSTESSVETMSTTSESSTVHVSTMGNEKPRETTPETAVRSGEIFSGGICESIEERKIQWPTTPENDEALVPCPEMTKGIARWQCRRIDGKVRFYPDKPDLSACEHSWTQEIDSQLQTGRSPVDIVQDLYNYLVAGTPLYGGDLRRSLQFLDSLVAAQSVQLRQQINRLNGEEMYDQAFKFTRRVGTTLDFLMTSANLQAWSDLPGAKKTEMLSLLMKLVEKSAGLLALFMSSENTTKLQYANYAVKVEVRQLAIHPPPAAMPARPFGVTLPDTASGQSVTDGVWTNQMPVSDATPDEPSSFDFSFEDDMAGISLPSDGIISAVISNRLHSAQTMETRASFRDAAGGQSQFANEDRLQLAYFVYSNSLSELLQPTNVGFGRQNGRKTIVNSQVIGASVDQPLDRLNLPNGQRLTLTLKHLRIDQNADQSRCVFWNLNTSSWDTDGCEVANSTTEFTVCSCSHLTSFAVLMDIDGTLEAELPDLHRKILAYATLIGCGLSASCLFICILVFTFVRSLWSVRNSVHRNLCITLLIGELLFIFGVDQTQNEIVCTVVAALLHYFFLSAFCWMFSEGVVLYTMLVYVFKQERSRLAYYYVGAYGAPAIVVAVAVGVDRSGYGTENYCWINADSLIKWAFVGPVAAVAAVNLLVLAIALKVAYGVRNSQTRTTGAKVRGWLKGSTMLLCLLGITWAFGFLLLIRPAAIYFAYLFTALNTLQGVFILVFHVFMNKSVAVALSKWMKNHHLPGLPSYYSVSTQSASSNESRLTWTKQVRTTKSSVGYGFNHDTSIHNQREMVQHLQFTPPTLCRRRNEQTTKRGNQQNVVIGDRTQSRRPVDDISTSALNSFGIPSKPMAATKVPPSCKHNHDVPKPRRATEYHYHDIMFGSNGAAPLQFSGRRRTTSDSSLGAEARPEFVERF